MKPNRFMRLLGIAEVERPIARKPIKQRFKALNASLAGLGPDWERQRGDAARVTAAVLRLDSEALLQRLHSEQDALELYRSTAAWLTKEADMLRKAAKRVEIASNRLSAVIARHGAERPPGIEPSSGVDHAPA